MSDLKSTLEKWLKTQLESLPPVDAQTPHYYRGYAKGVKDTLRELKEVLDQDKTPSVSDE